MSVLNRVPVREQDPKVRATNFDEVCLGYNMEEAMEEASRCINCKNAKCIQGCPVSINIPAFVKAVKEGKITEAADIRQSVDVYVRRRHSAKASVFVVSRVILFPSESWSVSLLITPESMAMFRRSQRPQTARRLLSSGPARQVLHVQVI